MASPRPTAAAKTTVRAKRTVRATPITQIKPKGRVARGWFHGCDASGWGGDFALNRQKNRGTAPARYTRMTATQINAFPELPAAQAWEILQASVTNTGAMRASLIPNNARQNGGRRNGGRRNGWRRNGPGGGTRATMRRHRPRLARARSRWTRAERTTVARWERRGVEVRGYLIAANRERFEAGNCYRPDLYDEHFWIVSRRREDKAEGLIAEITPRWRAAHRSWTLKFLRQLARRRARVEVKGWLLLDQAHPRQVGLTRAGLWEVHPVTGLRVLARRREKTMLAKRATGGGKAARARRAGSQTRKR